ncbi:kinase-like protein [Artomyces pyxidatus]|uniref:Kinase-like protein n=1 Tax=Artomyces pyxidatus TaxID=48021 RepID=A0ACB8SZK0_9AGAM|nr:kinase-like protein [Artomyces pyxidatus]
MNNANEIYAIKRVSLDKDDTDTMNGYMNEIALLKRLEGNSRIIRLVDSEIKAGPNGSKGILMLVMECGEIDLARLLQEQQKEPMNMVWVAYYWQQMLQAVHVIHEEKIVHSDLKPANFVLVRGQLKLIDFGIANAIANDTTNIQRDHQVGTVNYMSPEAIELPEGMRRLKVGRASDVWSLGCILYQMVYGHPPFHSLGVYQKMKAIPDLSYVIEFPEYATPTAPNRQSNGLTTPPKKLEHLKTPVREDVVQCMKSCLCRNPKERITIPELLAQDWLAMREPEPPAPIPLARDETIINPYYMRQLLHYGIRLGGGDPATLNQDDLLREAAVRTLRNQLHCSLLTNNTAVGPGAQTTRMIALPPFVCSFPRTEKLSRLVCNRCMLNTLYLLAANSCTVFCYLQFPVPYPHRHSCVMPHASVSVPVSHMSVCLSPAITRCRSLSLHLFVSLFSFSFTQESWSHNFTLSMTNLYTLGRS